MQEPGLKETYKLTCLMLDFLFFLHKVYLYTVTEPAVVERLDFHSWYKQSPDSALDLGALGKQLQNTASSSQVPSAVRDIAFESSNKLICNSSLWGLGKPTDWRVSQHFPPPLLPMHHSLDAETGSELTPLSELGGSLPNYQLFFLSQINN